MSNTPKANFTLLHDLVMIWPIPRPKKTESGIEFIEGAISGPIEGLVLAVGPGKVNKRDELVPLPLKAGDKVVFVAQSAREVKQGKDSFLVVPISEVLCKVNVEAA